MGCEVRVPDNLTVHFLFRYARRFDCLYPRMAQRTLSPSLSSLKHGLLGIYPVNSVIQYRRKQIKSEHHSQPSPEPCPVDVLTAAVSHVILESAPLNTPPPESSHQLLLNAASPWKLWGEIGQGKVQGRGAAWHSCDHGVVYCATCVPAGMRYMRPMRSNRVPDTPKYYQNRTV